MPDYALFNIKASVLTPMHIGSGETLLNEYDYAIHAGRMWRLNDAAILENQLVDDPAIANLLARTPPARLLKPGDFHSKSAFFRYSIRGFPRSTAEGAQLQEQIKDVFDQPYMPGSSLKGALRTALAWYGWEQKSLTPDLQMLKNPPRRHGDKPRFRNNKWAAADYEREIFVPPGTRKGKEPNYDLLRALHVSDSQPKDPEQLMLVNVRVISRGGKFASPIELEAIRPDTVFELTLKVDKALFSEWAEESGFQLVGQEWLTDLAEVVNQHTRQRIQTEINWYQQVPTGMNISSFYQRISNVDLGPNRFLLQLGWGTGWDDKTYGSRLKVDDHFMQQIIHEYKLSKNPDIRPDQFPSSRRVAIRMTHTQPGKIDKSPTSPLGWVLVEMTPQ